MISDRVAQDAVDLVPVIERCRQTPMITTRGLGSA
jgi:hypothetical protein